MSDTIQNASIDHSVWFHAPVDMTRWHLFNVHSSWSGVGRGLVRGDVFTESGQLVASLAQECLIRKLD